MTPKKTIAKKIIYAFASILLLSALVLPNVSVAGGQLSAPSLPISVKKYHREIEIEVPFYSPPPDLYSFSFPYSDEYFQSSSSVFDPQLAKASLGFAVSAFRNDTKGLDLPNQYETYLSGAGFSDIYSFGYDKPTATHTLSGVIAHKTIGNYTLIAAVTCGQGYQKEWAGNLEVGDEERHVGFNRAAQMFETEINSYIEEHHITGTMKLWLGGFSRAAAISNLAAADMINSGQFADVYAYLFGVPRTTKAAENYQGIYNICGAYDPITSFPLESWGFKRYGTDIFTPAQETGSDYLKLAAGADPVSQAVTGKPFRNNPQANYRVHLLIEFLAEMFPTSKDYSEDLQDTIMEVWKEPDMENILTIIKSVFARIQNLNEKTQVAGPIFLDFLSLIGSEHLSGETASDTRHWDPDRSIPMNYMVEHMFHTYLGWVFSENNSADIYRLTADTRRFILIGDFDLSVYHGDVLIGSINKKGKVSGIHQQEEGSKEPEIYLQRNGKETLVSLPMDEAYSLELSTNTPKDIAYYQVFNRGDDLIAEGGHIYYTLLGKGKYKLEPGMTSDLPVIESVDGDVRSVVELVYDYSPTMMMAAESSSKFHITPGLILQLIGGSIIGFAILGLICLVIDIIHAVRRKKRQRPYSNWWAIIPHLLLIVYAAGMTLFFAYNFYLIAFVRNAAAAVTMSFIFLLSLRGLLRCLRAKEEKGYKAQSKKKKAFGAVLSVVLVGLAAAAWFFTSKSLFISYSDLRAVIFIVIVALLSVLAILVYPERRKMKKQTEAAGHDD